MNANQNTADMKDRKVLLSTLWVVVMFNMAFADILSFIVPGNLEEMMTGSVGFQFTPGLILIFAILLEIPIAMIILSRVLKYRINRWVNIIASVITILFVIGGGSTDIHYIFFATIETVCMLLIIWFAWKWPNPEGLPT
jgi:Sec-independent protein secretion pathway component TatC